MKTKILTSILVLAGALMAQAQTAGQIAGRVIDAYDQPLEVVTVSLLQAADSNLVRASITDSAGNFELTADKEGRFLLGYTMIGYKPAYTAVFTAGPGAGYNAPLLRLQSESKQIKDVVITSAKPMIESHGDKLVFNVENSINATGSNALELLQKSPGVMVDNNENITLRGKNGVKVYIDGKMTQLDSKSLADYLKSINSSDVEAIELIANPGAKFDASGNAGIINIRLKKNKKFGTNGMAELGLGRGKDWRKNGSLSLNYRNKKLNVFSNISGAANKYENDLRIYRTQKDTVYNQQTVMYKDRKSLNIKAGADYFLDSKNTLGVLVNTNFAGGSFGSGGATDIELPVTGQLLKTIRSTNDMPQSSTNANFNLNYRYADTNGTVISFDGDYGLYRGTSRSYQPNQYYDAGNNYLYSVINGNRMPTDIDIYTAKLDIEHKLGKGKLGYGLKTAYVRTNNAFDFYNYNGDDQPIRDLGMSNSFVYTENVNAAYASYERPLGKQWNLKAGLRMEHTGSKGSLDRADGKVQADNVVKRDYLDFFPSAALHYKLNEANSFGLVYSRRIDRPDYQDLNPFEIKIDQLTFEKGNAFLKPQYTDNIELNYAFKSLFTASLSYSHVKDYAVKVADTINGNASYLQEHNIASQRILGLELGSSLPIAKWWTGYVNVWFNYRAIEGSFNNISLDMKSPGYGIYMQHTFQLGKGYSAELSSWYDGKTLEGTWKRKSLGTVDVGFRKKFLDDRATVKVTVTDVFRTMRFRALTDYGGTRLDIVQRNDPTSVRINFSYRFGSNEIREARQRKTASDSESSRIR
ncbi:TonB-dependent receptor [Taibaiella chishuiensis]|uniref:Outer membrane receptor protein involved in Fe transport n=1 Tax=Taibaiella chishuiensis TaxID=1434707 RepID=A0A2P8D0G6_9BACT|nr:TonB-dependent receptor [Taibaiella chishuiensis]PSK90701.1 outer membrane receptor protein involved in Fe transport [Taibaiella chishuiensis]